MSAQSHYVTSFLAIHFHRLTWSFLFVFLICGGNNFGEESLELRALFGHWILVTNFTNGNLMRKHIKWVKQLLQHEPFMPLSQEFILSGNL
jgi:hypothetical protein